MRSDFADEIAKKCLAHYQNLPKKGKPVPDKEWTLLSSVVTSLDRKLSVVAMATGTKCLGRSGMSPRGDLVNDSHAEVLARRCFLRYLYDQISKFKQTGDSDIITGLDDQHRYEINSKVEFHFYTSHVPCGDAAIIPKEETCKGKRKLESNEEVTTKRKRMDAVQPNKTECSRDIGPLDAGDSEKKGVEDDIMETLDHCVGEVIGDVYRTGAKCVTGQDSRLPGALYHTVGAVRTKPGRGDPTLSVSCSDKMARWVACGLQGALLSLLLSRPVLLSSVVIGSGGPYSQDVLQRAIITRTGTSHSPHLLHSSVIFPHSRYNNPTSRPCPSSILWALVPHKPLEVCVEGRRQGVTKKCRDNGRLMVCKMELLRSFLEVSGDRFQRMAYRDIKASADQYRINWTQTRSRLGAWTTKPYHLEHFNINE
ncbi:tRNA-specific adenosine deaminase 1 [Homalodisca vitripennis]|uniref:tRNA-specific adenosine deaminase 1 n=1 Tax=Homalodisca vitripennis TaxID=197043 RepID=UPI001EEBA47D|nr:tRNA-specific adenosine deaminase 1 [Homalodisca vitripennis]XP_046679015.1 tRNA-specific adenosine deaminase 1 [Homalodisca vitripennis]